MLFEFDYEIALAERCIGWECVAFSHSPQQRMEFGRGLDPFIRWFYKCGLSGYPSFDGFFTAKTKEKSFSQFIPTGMLAVFTIITSIVTCVSKFLGDPSFSSSTTSLFINTATLLTSVSLCLIQMVFLSPYFAEISSQISKIERLSWRKFSFDMVPLRRHFIRCVYITLVSVILPVIVKLYEKSFTWDRYIVTTGLAILRAIEFSILLHAFFYVDLLDHMLQRFVRHVNMRASSATPVIVQTISFRSPAAKQLTAEIFHFKLLHYNLWDISEKINHLFGWVIVIIFLQHFTYVVYNVYAAYSTLSLQSLSVFNILRKSIGLVVRC